MYINVKTESVTEADDGRKDAPFRYLAQDHCEYDNRQLEAHAALLCYL